MVERVQLVVQSGALALQSACERYGLLERVASAARRQGVEFLAFGLGHDEFRLVLGGTSHAIGQVVRGVRVGTCGAVRARGDSLVFRDTVRLSVENVETSVIWAHRVVTTEAAAGPLASPWTSHRDILGFRRAQFFCAESVLAYIDPERVHAALGGRGLPCAEERLPHRPSVPMLMRLCAAVQGVLPADRRSFGLFTQVARSCGWRTVDVADALMLTERRIRQLANQDASLLETALLSLRDPRLCVVP